MKNCPQLRNAQTLNNVYMVDKIEYERLIESVFRRFPSVQKTSFAEAYKPGLDNIRCFCRKLGNPQDTYRTIHVAGTNGKGSVSSMLASVLSGAGLRTGLYTSPHIADFRERMKISVDGKVAEMVSEEYVYDFIVGWQDVFDEMGLSFFEITTAMAFKWFADMGVDIAVIETGLGGRLDSTNIIRPDLSVVSSIGLDHCDILGSTIDRIAYEKAGIFKPGVPAVVGHVSDDAAKVLRERYAVIQDMRDSVQEAGFISGANVDAGRPKLVFADDIEPHLWHAHERILSAMDLRGSCQRLNLRTVLCALDVLASRPDWRESETFQNALSEIGNDAHVAQSIERTAERMDFHGRWERISSSPDVICDIGHNPQALALNFKQLEDYLRSGEYSSLIIVYGVMADKAFSEIMPLFPDSATWFFCTPDTRRALPSSDILSICKEHFGADVCNRMYDAGSVASAVRMALKAASEYGGHPLVYIGGSTFVVSEASRLLLNVKNE